MRIPQKFAMDVGYNPFLANLISWIILRPQLVALPPREKLGLHLLLRAISFCWVQLFVVSQFVLWVIVGHSSRLDVPHLSSLLTGVLFQAQIPLKPTNTFGCAKQ